MRYIFALITMLFSTAFYSPSLWAVEWEDRKHFKGSTGTNTLSVISTADTDVFSPIIESFLQDNPDVSIEYLVAGSSDIYSEFQQSSDQYDVVISSAMDLQLKLVNDGFALRTNELQHPGWAQWRQSLFGFTLEPAAIVINKAAFKNLPIPKSRQEMIETLRRNPNTFKGRIGTYDVRASGLGYLFATQDARRSETYWRLTEIMGSLDVRLYRGSGEMIEDLAVGKIAISYNVLGSYADARTELADKIEVILPSEFPTTMMRTALVSANSTEQAAATSFVRYLISSQWGAADDSLKTLPSLQHAPDTLQRSAIALEPGLMIFLDRMKRQNFIDEWERAIIQ